MKWGVLYAVYVGAVWVATVCVHVSWVASWTVWQWKWVRQAHQLQGKHQARLCR